MAAKLEVQVHHCFCCGLTPGALLIGLYSLLLYALLTGLAAWALSETAWNGDRPIFESCEEEAQGRGRDNRIKFGTGNATVVVEDSSSYHCSLGLYTEEMKFSKEGRYLALLVALCLYVPLVLASLLLLAGVVLGSPWLLVPWLVLLPLDILRGLISSVLILVLSHGLLARIAAGIFFLGLQFLHISLWILVLAKFQRLRHRRQQLSSSQHFAVGGGRPPFPPPPHNQRHQAYGIYGPGSATAYSPQSERRLADEYPPPGSRAVHQQHFEPERY